MQTVTSQFTALAQGQVRPISYRLLMSFAKTFDDDIDFFTIGVSTIGGTDIIKGEGDVIQEWDKYDYVDFTDRVISLEWSREQDMLSSVYLAMADLVLDNHDGYFTPGAGSPIDDYILPNRPIKIAVGFGGENVPVFVGLTEKMADINELEKTATFHCIDFLSSLMNRPLDESIMLTDVTTDEALDELFQLAGLTPTQYNLSIGFNVIRFLYFEKGTKLGEAIRELMEAEMGRLYLDENGIIQFKNRQEFNDTSVYSFDESNIINIETSKQDDIINVVEIKANVRQVEELQKAWEPGELYVVPAGGSVEVWADFADPVTSVNDPVYSTYEITDSFFYVNSAEDNSGSTTTDVTLTDSVVFGTSAMFTFENASGIDYYITKLHIWATPAIVVNPIYLREEDSVSIAKYDEHPIVIENEFIQRSDEAYSKAKILLDDNSEYGAARIADVKGNPALQLNDVIDITLADIGEENYIINRISGVVSNGRLGMVLYVKQRDPAHYFTIGVSTIGGTDIIAP